MSLKILLTNDDGFKSPGLWALYRELSKWGQVFVAAPSSEKSASGHAVTLTSKIRVEKKYKKRKLIGLAINGTPADCVKFAFKKYYGSDLPDMVISGLNPVANTGASIYYSGTIAAAREAVFSHVPAFALSLVKSDGKHFPGLVKVSVQTVKKIYSNLNTSAHFYNINIPSHLSRPRGIQITHQSHSRFEEEFVSAGKKNSVQSDYYLKGKMSLLTETGFSDEEAIRKGYVSVTPCQLDVSAYQEIRRLQKVFSRKRSKGEAGKR